MTRTLRLMVVAAAALAVVACGDDPPGTPLDAGPVDSSGVDGGGADGGGADGGECSAAADCEAELAAMGYDPQCTELRCEAGACVFDSAPRDGEACTSEDLCREGATCVGRQCVGAIKDCDDASGCTVDSCDASTGLCRHDVDTTASCTPEGACEGAGECLQSGDCVCTVQGDCETTADCVQPEDLCAPRYECVETKCVVDSASAVVCPTSNNTTCRMSLCQPDTGQCLLTPQNAGLSCASDDICTTAATCQADGTCVGADLGCDDGDACTSDACVPSLGGCVHNPVTGPCDDGDSCTELDTCAGGVCVGQPRTCDDGKVCTADSCDQVLGCQYAFGNIGAICDDTNPCTLNETCQAGGCTAESTVDCDDGDDCTIDFCAVVGAAAECQTQPQLAGACDDGDPCTEDDHCDQGVCVGTNTCECKVDGDCLPDPCATAYTCDKTAVPYECVPVPGTAIICAPNETFCSVDECNPANGQCQPVAKNEALECDDGDACSTISFCDTGICVAGELLDCEDGNPCTSDFCVGGTCTSGQLTGGLVLLDENFDGAPVGGLPAGWTAGTANPNVTWRASSTYSFSGNGMVVTGPGDTYDYGQTLYSYLRSPAIQMPGETLKLRYKVIASVAQCELFFDTMKLVVELAGLGSGIPGSVICDSQGGWLNVELDLSGYTNTTIYLRWVFSADATVNAPGFGVAIDDVVLEATYTCDEGDACTDNVCQAGQCVTTPIDPCP